MRIAVIGGGIAGLAGAWELVSSGAEVALYEPGHLGGKLVTSEFLGRPVDEGPDSLLARVPEGIALCAELGLSDQLQPPSASEALVWHEGRLRPLPHGLVLGVPARLGPLARSGFLSPAGLARAGAEAVLPQTPLGDDASLWHLVASRFGRQVADRLVEPLVGGIYAGWTRGLSAEVSAPQLLAAAKANRSLLLALRKTAGRGGTPGATGPVFVAPRSGMQSIADRIVRCLRAEGAALYPFAATGLRRDGQAVVVEPAGERYDGAIVAVPAPAATGLLSGLGVEMGQVGNLQFASVGIVTLAVPEGPLHVPALASGLLVAPPSDLFMTACSFGNNKWPHWAEKGALVLRVSMGKAGDQRWSALSDEALAARAADEVARALGTGRRRASAGLTPVAWRVSRWPAALPQYQVGHLKRVAALRSELEREAPMVSLAGASYSRVGVPACIASGRQAAAAVRQAVDAASQPVN